MSVEKQDDKRVRYCGIADAHGIESFQKKETTNPRSVFIMQMRAGLNRQRHAVYYEVELLPKYAERVLEILNGDLNKYMAQGVNHTKVCLCSPSFERHGPCTYIRCSGTRLF